MCDSVKNISVLATEHFRLGKNECSGSFTKEPKAAGKELRRKLQTLVSIATHMFIMRVWPRQCSMPVHAGFEVLVLLLDLRKALIQLHIFVSLEGEQTKRNEDNWGSSCFPTAPHLTSFSSSINFFSCWWSCWFLISTTTLRLSNSCSRYKVWESLCQSQESQKMKDSHNHQSGLYIRWILLVAHTAFSSLLSLSHGWHSFS